MTRLCRIDNQIVIQYPLYFSVLPVTLFIKNHPKFRNVTFPYVWTGSRKTDNILLNRIIGSAYSIDDLFNHVVSHSSDQLICTHFDWLDSFMNQLEPQLESESESEPCYQL